jgi:hypothetical protein
VGVLDPEAAEAWTAADSKPHDSVGDRVSPAPWKALPAQLGSASTCHARFQAWSEGILRRLFEKLVELYDEICGIEWEWTAGRGVPLSAKITANKRAAISTVVRSRRSRPGMSVASLATDMRVRAGNG